MAYKRDFNIFAGSDNGILKGIKVGNNGVISKNFHNISALSLDFEVCSMAWGDPEEMDVLMGLRNQTVKVYDTDFKLFTKSIDVSCGKGPVIGVSRFDGTLVTAVSSGIIKLWKFLNEEQVTVDTIDTKQVFEKGGIRTEKTLACMQHSNVSHNIIATGGKENDLKLWDFESSGKNIFTAKNVRLDALQLRVPVWVSSITFLQQQPKVALCTRHGHVRLYDPKAQRRPVINMEIPDTCFTAISAASRDEHVIVGTNTGRIMLFDLRGKGKSVQHYKGCVGAVRDIKCHKSLPYIVSVGLDRHLLVHDLNTKKTLRKIYLKSKLNCVLIRSDFSLDDIKEEEKNEVNVKRENDTEDIELVELSDSNSENGDDDCNMDQIFDKLDKVEEPIRKRRKV